MSQKVMRGKPSDHPYLHKDFHGALSFAATYVEQQFGAEGLAEFLHTAARNVYRPLFGRIRRQGLPALRDHLQDVFSKEGGEFKLTCGDAELVIEVTKCPAISHMRDRGYEIAEHFCEITRIVNRAIAEETGYGSSVEYAPEQGACVQRFWRKSEGTNA